MKARRVVGVTVVLLGLLFAGTLSRAHAVNYLGEFCWQAADGGVGKFAVNDMGGGHFLLNGKTIKPGGALDGLAYGTAEIVGSQIFMVITTMGSDTSNTWASTNWVVLNLSNLNGTLEGVGLSHSKSDPNPSNVQLEHESSQSLTFIPCP